MDRVQFSGTPEEARALIRDIPGILSGRLPDRFGLVDSVLLRGATALLSCIQRDFETKARGGVGKDGIRWPPLQPSTIAQRRIPLKAWRAAGLKGTPTKNKYTRGLLTEEQERAWKKKFAQTMAWARMDRPEKEAKRLAAKVAWKFVKDKMGAKTMLQLFGNRDVEILRDTDKLFLSFSPGYADRPAFPKPEGQILIVTAGRIVVGSSEKPWHHRGIEGRLPARPFWPLNDEIPEAWWEVINRNVMEGVMEIIGLLLRKAA